MVQPMRTENNNSSLDMESLEEMLRKVYNHLKIIYQLMSFAKNFCQTEIQLFSWTTNCNEFLQRTSVVWKLSRYLIN